MSDGVDLATLSSDADTLLNAVIAQHSIAITGSIVNLTPFKWDRVKNLGSPRLPSSRDWGKLLGRSNLIGPSAPVWHTAPTASIDAANSNKAGKLKAVVNHFGLGGDTSLNNDIPPSQRGGAEAAIPYICASPLVVLVLFIAVAKGSGGETYLSGATAFNTNGLNFSVPGGDDELIGLVHKWMADETGLNQGLAKVAFGQNGTVGSFDLPLEELPGKTLHFETTSGKKSQFILTLKD